MPSPLLPLAFVLLSLSLWSCQFAKTPLLYPSSLQAAATTPPSSQNFILQTHAHLLHTTAQRPLHVLPDQLVFTSDQRFAVGDVLLGRGRNGQPFLRRVVRSDGQGRVWTSQAQLGDVFQILDAQASIDPRHIKPIELDRRSFQIGLLTIESTLKAWPDLSDFRLRIQEGRALFVRFAPELKLNWEITSRATFSTPLSGAELLPTLTMKPVGEVNFRNFTIEADIGPVPVTIYIRPGAALEWGHQGIGQLEWGGSLNGRLKAAVEMTARLTEKPDFQTRYEYDYGGQIRDPRLNFDGRVLSRLHLPRLRLESEIAGMVGPYVDTSAWWEGELNARLKVTGQLTQVTGQAEAHLGLGLKVGLPKTELFGEHFNEDIHKTLVDRRIKQLYKKELNYTLPSP